MRIDRVRGEVRVRVRVMGRNMIRRVEVYKRRNEIG
jgi:hypothetical protein